MTHRSKTCYCIRCETIITAENDSREHVFTNAIGGRLKVRGFLCRRCNSEAGETWDAALAEQMQPFCHLFGIVRERGEVPPLPIVTTAGERVTMLPGGGFSLSRPVVERTPVADGMAIHVRARDQREARRILTDLKKKHPEVDVEATLSRATETRTYPEGLIHHTLEFGGNAAGRSMVKTAAAMAFRLGVPASACDIASSYLRGDAIEPPFGYYDTSDVMEDRPAGRPLHCAAVAGDPLSGLLLGYIEYFGAVRIVVCLSESYTGAPLKGAYAIDPSTGETLAVDVSLPFDRGEMAAIYAYKRSDPQRMKAAMEAVIGPAVARKQANGYKRALQDAAKYAFTGCGVEEGKSLPREQVGRFSRLLCSRLTPYLLQQMASKSPY